MDKKLLISVVIPLYNNEKYIQRAVLSVLAQTVQDYELIIIEDGSSDTSYQQVVGIQDARVRVIRQENQGASAARNTGVEQASSPLI